MIIYLIGFFVCPVLLVALNKIFSGSMGLDGDDNFLAAMILNSFFWPLGLLLTLFLLLLYWRDH